MGESVVTLSHPTALATKLHRNLGSKVQTEPYGDGKYFKGETVPIDNLAQLHELLQVMRKDTRSFIVRGEIIPGTDLERMRRLKKTKDGEHPTLREVPRRWMMIDVDSLDKNYTPEWGTKDGCQAAADKLLGQLPMELRTAGFIWQVSASAGVKGGLRMHLFFWLDRPLGEAELTRWGENVNDNAGIDMLDLSVFRTVQPLYVADPLFENMLDPVAQRLGFVPGAAAVLPKLTSRADAWKQKLQPLYYESNNKIHDHVRDACASYFCAHGPDADDDPLRRAVLAGVARAHELQNRSDYTEDRLSDEIESGRNFARGRVQAGENLLSDNTGTPKGCIANLLAVMQSHEDWRRLLAWNVRAGRIEVLKTTPWGSPLGEWRDSVDSVHAAQWFAQQKRMAVDDGTVLRAATAYARELEVDPASEWLESLEWDGERGIDTWLIDFCGADDTPYVRRVSRMFLIGAVARALWPGCKHDTCLVLQGETGIGKSTALKVLFDPWFARLTEEKDMLQKIHGPWGVELPELGPFRSMNYNRIKSFLSEEMDRFRAPYMRLPEDRPRRCVLAATVNPEGIGWNQDPTSARRFHPVTVGECDVAALKEERDQLFAEAVSAFKAGEPWWVEDPKDPIFQVEQAKVYANDTWETIFERVIKAGGQAYAPGGRPVSLAPNATEFDLVDLMAVAFSDHKTELRDQARAARALIKIGFVTHGRMWIRVDSDHGPGVKGGG